MGNTIQSVLDQTKNDWELIVVDDGSTDNTKRLVEGFDKPQIRYFYQENKGPSAARNLGLRKAKGNWIAYIDSDNELLPNYLETMGKWIEKNPKVLYFLPRGHKTRELIQNNKVTKSIDATEKNYPPTLTIKDIFMRNMQFDGNGFMHDRKIIDEGILWDEDLSLCEEWEYVMRVATRFPNNFLYVPVFLFNYHQRFGGDGLVSNASYTEWAETFEYIDQKHKNDPLLKGQKWYPERVTRYTKLEKDVRQGKAPPAYLRYFVKTK